MGLRQLGAEELIPVYSWWILGEIEETLNENKVGKDMVTVSERS